MGRKQWTLEFESGKERKKHKEKGKKKVKKDKLEAGYSVDEEKVKKDELETNSSVNDVCGDNKGKEVEGLKYDKSGEDHMSSGEEANKKKKRKREKDGDDIVPDMRNKKKRMNYGEESVGKIVEKVDSAGNVKRNKILEDGKIGVATEYGVVDQRTNKGGKKKKKEKKETSGGELVQNITSDGMEAGVTSKCLEGHIVEKGDLALEGRKKEKRKHGKKTGTEGQESVAEKGTETSEPCIRNKEAVDVENGGKTRKKKAKSETPANGEVSSRNVDAVDVEDGKKRKKAKSEKHVSEDCDRKSEGQESVEKGDLAFEGRKKEKRKHGKKTGTEGRESVAEKGTETGEPCIRNKEAVDVEDGGKTRKKKAKSETPVNGEVNSRNVEGVDVEDGKKRKKAKSETPVNGEVSSVNAEAVGENSKKRKKSKSEKHGYVEDCNKDEKKARSSKGSLRAPKSIGDPDNSEKSSPKKVSKRVSFADDVEVFSLSDGPSDEHEDLVRGKRFSKEEDKIIEEAVLRYIEEHALGDDGINMVLHSKSHPELRTCWKDIGAALPWRPFKSVYCRAHNLFERAEKRNWTPEEYEEVRKFHKDKGADWRTLADRLGKHRIHVKDAWRRIKLPNQKKGRWSQEEYETLFDLVNMDLRMKVFEEKKSKHGMLRDNICWEAISETLGTRTNAVCSMKWYSQLTSPLVSQKLWADIDDYRLLDALNSLDACCIEDVDWDDLLEHRPGDVCQKRWYEMVKHIGHHGLKSFSEQVEVLSKRYLADLIEAKEIYANKPVVD